MKLSFQSLFCCFKKPAKKKVEQTVVSNAPQTQTVVRDTVDLTKRSTSGTTGAITHQEARQKVKELVQRRETLAARQVQQQLIQKAKSTGKKEMEEKLRAMDPADFAAFHKKYKKSRTSLQ
jgi:adenylosuccinate lyase